MIMPAGRAAGATRTVLGARKAAIPNPMSAIADRNALSPAERLAISAVVRADG